MLWKTLERNSDCIDHMTSLVSDLKVTMDRKHPQYKPKYTRVGHETKCWVTEFYTPEIDPSVGEEIKVVIEEITTIGVIIDKL